MTTDLDLIALVKEGKVAVVPVEATEVPADEEAARLHSLFGFHPTQIGLRHRAWWVVDAPDDDDVAVGAGSGYLCVRARDGGSNDIDTEALRRENFHNTKEDDFDRTYRYYWFKPLAEKQDLTPALLALIEERDRLRKALTEICALREDIEAGDWEEFRKAQSIARRALTEKNNV